MRKWLLAVAALFLFTACAVDPLDTNATFETLTIREAQVEPQGDGSAIITMIIDNDGAETYVFDKIELADGSIVPFFEGETTNREIAQGDVISEGDNDPAFPDTIEAEQVTPIEIPLLEIDDRGFRLDEGTAFGYIPEFTGQPGDFVTMTLFFSSDGTVTLDVPVVTAPGE